MKFNTQVAIHPLEKKMEHHDAFMFLGSCFSDNIGAYFHRAKFQSCINPFGVIYNPVSVANSLELMLNPDGFDEKMLVESDGLWHSFLHHGRFSSFDKEELLQKMDESIQVGSRSLTEANYLFITFGTSWVYEWKETGEVVSNCHKIPASSFNAYRLEMDEIVAQYKQLLVQIFSVNPSLKIIFTVSPVRHLKNGAHENQLSKAVLLLAVNHLCDIFEQCSYFPSYEVVLDELRDYRFFESDMVHVNTLATDYLWEKITELYLSKKAREIIKEVDQISRAVAHRPFNPTDPNYLSFIKNTIDKITRLQQAYPYIKMQSEQKKLSEINKNYED